MKKFYLIPMMVVLALLCGCYSDNDEPIFPQVEDEELTETKLNQQMFGKFYQLTEITALEHKGEEWKEVKLVRPAIYNFLTPYVNKYFWSKGGVMYVDFNFKENVLLETFGDDFMDFNNYMAENNNFSFPFLIATSLKYNADTQTLSTSNQAFDMEEVSGMRFVVESFKNDILVIRTEYNETNEHGISAHRAYYKVTTEIPSTSRDFGSKSEFLEFFDQIVNLWAESRGKVKPTL